MGQWDRAFNTSTSNRNFVCTLMFCISAIPGNTPAHLAAKHGHYHIVRYLSHAMDLHQHHNHAGKTPLMYTRSAKKKHLRGWLRGIRSKDSYVFFS